MSKEIHDTCKYIRIVNVCIDEIVVKNLWASEGLSVVSLFIKLHKLTCV